MPSADLWHGVLPVDKPSGMTSHDVVSQVRHIFGQRGVGHTGTLDPRATGLLILCLGRATKVAQFISSFEKTYMADICLGRSSTTYDGEGLDSSVPATPVPELDAAKLAQLLTRYTGKIRQRVPAFSAVKVQGQPLYRAARRGENVEPPEREVEITSLRLLSYLAPYMRIELTCAKGTYVRSLAHDIGQHLGCGAYLASLRRTRVGSYSIDRAHSLPELEKKQADGRLAGLVLPVEKVLNYAAFKVTDEFSRQVVSGRALRTPDLVSVEGDFHAGDRVVLKDAGGQILAIGTASVDANSVGSDPKKPLFTYLRVLN